MSVRSGNEGELIPDGLRVVRLSKLSLENPDLLTANVGHFDLSTDDKESRLQSLSVWIEDLTPPLAAREFMEKKEEYRLAVYLNVDDIRQIRLTDDPPGPSLNVVWDPRPEPGSEGHAGIIGLMRPRGGNKLAYKALRDKLARIATVELLPEIEV